MAEVVIGARIFQTKQKAIEYCREILYSYYYGETVSDGEHAAFLADLLLQHPDAGRKIGAGVESFQVRLNLKTPGFWVLRSDGSETDFSFYKCLRAPSLQDRARAALRFEVVEQILSYKNQVMAGRDPRCALTGSQIWPELCHIDHVVSFEQLADRFAESEGGYEVLRVESVDGRFGTRLGDLGQAGRWRQFHLEAAELRAVTPQANLRRKRR